MNNRNVEYFNECVKSNDLTVMGIYNPKTKYSIFHKWGKEKDVKMIIDIMKKSAYSHALDVDYIVAVKYPIFTLEDFDKFITMAGYFGTWYESNVLKK
jgi:hypothetical protein